MSIRTVFDTFTSTGNNQHGTPLVTVGRLKGLTFIIGCPDDLGDADLDFDIQLPNGIWLANWFDYQTNSYAVHFITGSQIHVGSCLIPGLPDDTVIQAIRTDINIASLTGPIYVQLQAED